MAELPKQGWSWLRRPADYIFPELHDANLDLMQGNLYDIGHVVK